MLRPPPILRGLMYRFLHRCLTHTPVLGLLIAALVFRALIPMGFMPTQGENGHLVMELCAGFGTKSVVVDLGDDAAPSSDAGAELFERSVCGFAVAALTVPPATQPAFPAILALQSPVALAPVTAITTPSILKAESPRAPPLI